jgi:hypothetical protein
MTQAKSLTAVEPPPHVAKAARAAAATVTATATTAATATAAAGGQPVEHKPHSTASGDANFKRQFRAAVEEVLQLLQPVGGRAGLRGMGSAQLALLGLSEEAQRQVLGSRSFMRMRNDQKMVRNGSGLGTAGMVWGGLCLRHSKLLRTAYDSRALPNFVQTLS